MTITAPNTENDFDTLLRTLAQSEQKDSRTELYKFHQERTEKIRTRLWTTLTWLVGVQGLILGIQQQQLRFTGVDIEEPVPSIILAVVGTFLSIYMVLVVSDGTKHIESNWHSADVVLGKTNPHAERSFLSRWKEHPVFGLMALLGIGLIAVHLSVVVLRYT